MKTLFSLLVTGALLSSLAYGTEADERFRIKYGRYSPSAELRNRTGARAATEEIALCCRTTSALGQNVTDERLRAKLGRSTPSEEIRDRRAAGESAVHAEKCLELATCSRMNETASQAEVGA